MTGLAITDHAMLRYLERVGGLDVPALRTAIAASLARASATAETIGVADYTVVAHGVRYVVRQGNVVTVLPGRLAAPVPLPPERDR